MRWNFNACANLDTIIRGFMRRRNYISFEARMGGNKAWGAISKGGSLGSFLFHWRLHDSG